MIAVQRAVEVLVAAVAIVALEASAWPASVGLLVAAEVFPVVLVRGIAEADLRARTAQGALSLQVSDGLRAADALAAHRAGPVLRR
ncbi:MAG: hypothetical protein M3417_07125, partial [Actinomycetota bacterium]|nr:hypothetical protein [Actinomycetota bacterium]